MSQISKEQWVAIEEKLKSDWFPTVSFQFRKHEVSVSKERYSENRPCLVVYIDGVWKGVWTRGDDEVYGPLVKLFWRKRTSAIFKPKQKAKIIKNFGKRKAKEYFPKLDEVSVRWMPDFNTAASLVRQFKKVDGLTLLDGKADEELA